MRKGGGSFYIFYICLDTIETIVPGVGGDALKWRDFLYFKRLNHEQIIPLMEEVDRRIAEKIRLCGETVYVAECAGCGTKHFKGVWHCKNRYCLVCQKKRALVWARKVLERMQDIPTGVVYSLLTMTVRSLSSLSDMYSYIISCWRAFRKRYRKVFCDVLGGVRSIEVKKGAVGWHVHIHVLLAHYPGRLYEKIRDAWKDVTRGNGSIDVRLIRDTKGVMEVVKYSLKTIGIKKEDLAEMVEVLKGKRLVEAFGIFRGIREDEDLDNVDEAIEFICKVCGCTEYDLRVEIFSDVSSLLLYDTV